MRSAFARFLVSGLFNTAATYVLYLVLLQFLGYRTSYTISYLAGIALAYELNRSYVFRARRTLGSMVATPVVYAIQYALGLAVVTVSVRRLGLDERFAPLLAIACTVPVTFLLTRLVFRQGRDGAAS